MPGSVNFYLKKPPSKHKDKQGAVVKSKKQEGKSLIYLKFKYSGQVLVFTFDQTIDAANWNDKKQRVKSNTQTTKDGDHSLNDLLDNLEEVLENAYKSEIKNGVPLPATLKKYLIDFIEQNKNVEERKKTRPTLFNLIDRFISGEIKGKQGKERSEGSRDNYNATKKHLLAFQAKHKYPIDFDSITVEFFYSYVTFLKKQYTYKTRGPKGKTITGIAHNTIAKDISLIKVFMNKAVSLGYTSNLAYKHEDFCFSEEESDAVYLKENELVHLFGFPVENSKLDETKDLFIFGAFTGLRFSDYSTVSPENIIEEEGDYYIKKKTQKTGEWVYIPCHPIVRKVFEKYQGRPNKLPKTISNQKFNDYIKEVCKLAGLTEKGRLVGEPKKELWECVSSHTARRSFATNLFLQGFPVLEIMKITGHKTEKAFMKYIRVSKLDTAKRLSEHMKKKWSEKLLRVA